MLFLSVEIPAEENITHVQFVEARLDQEMWFTSWIAGAVIMQTAAVRPLPPMCGQ